MYSIPPDEWTPHLSEGRFWIPRCTKPTKRGTQCKHYIFGGQVETHDAQGQSWITQSDADKLHAGLCPMHAKLATK